jgi:hypothetical protein
VGRNAKTLKELFMTLTAYKLENLGKPEQTRAVTKLARASPPAINTTTKMAIRKPKRAS